MNKKKGVNVAAIAAGAVVICLIAIVTALAVKAKKEPETETSTVIPSVTQSETYSYTEPASVQESTSETETTTQPVTETTTAIASQVATTIQNISTTVTQKVTEKTTKEVSPEMTSTKVASGASESSVASASNWKDLPRDMSFAGLSTQGYSVIGKKMYIYNDDMAPNCSQRNLGYNSFYDQGAKLIDFTIDTVKFKFNYGGKTYRIQLWKGQYISGDIGTFGGEVGIYTHKGENFIGDHYECARPGEELYMEMTMLYDEQLDGNYIPQLTRNYALHWWETGYVDGQLHNKRDSSSLRLLNRITCKDETQAKAFATAMANKGFTEVKTFDPTVPDTFKRYGKEIIYIWWNVR